MHRLMKQSIPSSGKLANDDFDIKYFSARLNFGWVILSLLKGVVVSTTFLKNTSLLLTGQKSTFTEQLSWRKVSYNYWWSRGSDWTPWTWPGKMFSCLNSMLKLENRCWPKTKACRKNSQSACGASPDKSEGFPIKPIHLAVLEIPQICS